MDGKNHCKCFLDLAFNFLSNYWFHYSDFKQEVCSENSIEQALGHLALLIL